MSSSCSFSIKCFRDYYDVLAEHNIKDISEAAIVGLGEIHDHEKRALNGSFISLNAKLRPVAIFCEGIPALDEKFGESLRLIPKAFERFKEMNLIASDVPDENIHFFGWDVLDLGSECSSIDKKQAANATVSHLMILQDASLARICLLIPQFTLEGFKESGLEWMLRLTKEDYKAFLEEMKNFSQISKDLKKASELAITLAEESQNRIEKSFLSRVDSMVQTVRKISRMQADGSLPALAFIVAGQMHFEDLSDADPAYDLSSWHAEIALHRAIILCEKEMHSMAKRLMA